MTTMHDTYNEISTIESILEDLELDLEFCENGNEYARLADEYRVHQNMLNEMLDKIGASL